MTLTADVMSSRAQDSAQYEALINQAVEAKLLELDALPMGMSSGRRLQLQGQSLSALDVRERLGILMTDIAKRLGLHFFQMMEAVPLEQFCIMSAIANHDTAGLLKSLINSFMVSYMTPETNKRSFGQLESLEALHHEVKVLTLVKAMSAAPSVMH